MCDGVACNFWMVFELGTNKSEIDKSVRSLCGLAPAQSQMDLFLNNCARNKQRAANLTDQKKPCHT